MSKLWEGAIQTVQGILGINPAEGSPDAAASPTESAAHQIHVQADAHGARSPDMEEEEVTHSSSSRATPKRPREETEESGNDASEKRQRIGDTSHQRRLIPQFEPQMDVKPLEAALHSQLISGHLRVSREGPSVRRKPGKDMGHKPRDTIGRKHIKTHSHQTSTKAHGPSRVSKRSLEVESSAGSNVLRRDAITKPASKKRKSIDGSGLSMTQDTPDGIPNPEDLGVAVGRGGQAKSASRVKPASDHFALHESQAVDRVANQGIKHGAVKNRRPKHNDGSRSSQSSPRAQTPVGLPAGQESKQEGTRNQPVDVDGDQVSLASCGASLDRKPNSYSRDSVRPAIDLEKDMRRPQRKRSGEVVPEPVRDETIDRVLPTCTTPELSAHLSGSRITGQPRFRSKHNTRDVFRRSDSREDNTRISPIDEDQDELAGANTQLKALPRPRSKLATTTDSNVEAPRCRSPTDLRPTDFIHKHPGAISANSSQAVESRDDEEASRIPIRSIYCKSCVLENVPAALVWSKKSQTFKIEKERETQLLPGKDMPIRIGKNAVSEGFMYDANLPRVLLKGVANDVASRVILIVFVDRQGLFTCRDEFLHVNGNTMKVGVGMRDGLFEKQMEDAKKTFNLQQERLLDSERQLQWANPRRSKYFQSNDDEESEHVKYEEENHKSDRARSGVVESANVQGRSLPKNLAAQSTRYAAASSQSRSRSSPYWAIEDRPRRFTRRSEALKPESPERPVTENRWSVLNNPRRWSRAVVYPAQPAPRRVTVDFDDLSRLDEGEFLNDSVLDFALRQIEENMAAEHRKDVHFFNTYLYTALSTKDGKKRFNYDAVKRWTSKIDLFSFPYVVVPINLELHWFVAIISNLPDVQRIVSLDGDDSDEAKDSEVVEATLNRIPCEALLKDQGSAKSSPYPTQRLSELSISELNENSSQPEILAADTDAHTPEQDSKFASRRARKKTVPPPRKYNKLVPTIITLDSFGQARPTEIKYLKEYLKAEADDKRGMALDVKSIQGLTAKGIPEQPNFCDCGVYVVGYIQEFAKNPRQFVEKVLSREMRRTDFDAFDPSQTRADLRDQLLALSDAQEAEYLARKKNRTAKKKASVSPVEKSAPDSKPMQPLAASSASVHADTSKRVSADEETTAAPVHPLEKVKQQQHDRELGHESQEHKTWDFTVLNEHESQNDQISVSPPRPLGGCDIDADRNAAHNEDGVDEDQMLESESTSSRDITQP